MKRSKEARSPRSNKHEGFQPVEGMAIEIQDEYQVWSAGTVIKVKPANKSTKNTPIVVVRYDGWGPEWDESIPWNSPRIARLFTYTRQVKCFVQLLTKVKTKPSAQELANLPSGAPKAYSTIWPCTVQLRMPHPTAPIFVSGFLSAKEQLRLEPKVHILPYGVDLLPHYLRTKTKKVGAGWHDFTLLVPWTDKPEMYGVCQRNFYEALAIAKADTTIIGTLPADVMQRGSLLRDQYLVKDVGGTGRLDGALVHETSKASRADRVPSEIAFAKGTNYDDDDEDDSFVGERKMKSPKAASIPSAAIADRKRSITEAQSEIDSDDEPLFKKIKARSAPVNAKQNSSKPTTPSSNSKPYPQENVLSSPFEAHNEKTPQRHNKSSAKARVVGYAKSLQSSPRTVNSQGLSPLSPKRSPTELLVRKERTSANDVAKVASRQCEEFRPLPSPLQITKPLFPGLARCRDSSHWLASIASGGNAEIILGSFPMQSQAKQVVDLVTSEPGATFEEDAEAAAVMDNGAVTTEHVIEAFESQSSAGTRQSHFSMHVWTMQHIQQTTEVPRRPIPSSNVDSTTSNSKRKGLPHKLKRASNPHFTCYMGAGGF